MCYMEGGSRGGGGQRAGMLDRLTTPGDGCRITNQSTPASARGREREGNSQTRLVEKDHVSQVPRWLLCRPC